MTILSLFLLLILNVSANQNGISFDLLKNQRSNITFFPMTAAQRVKIAIGAQALFSVMIFS